MEEKQNITMKINKTAKVWLVEVSEKKETYSQTIIRLCLRDKKEKEDQSKRDQSNGEKEDHSKGDQSKEVSSTSGNANGDK